MSASARPSGSRYLQESRPECSSSNRSNALLINEDIMFFCSTVSAKAVFTDMKGDILRVINRSGISYRAYWIDSKPKE